MPAPERFLSDEGMNVYDAAIKVIGELKAEIAKKNDELTRIKSKTWCAYCGHEIERDDEAAQKISEHISTCPKHPMRVWERHCEALEEQAKQYKDEIAELKRRLINVLDVVFPMASGSQKEEIASLREALAKRPFCPPIIDMEQRNIGKYPPIPDDFMEDKP